MKLAPIISTLGMSNQNRNKPSHLYWVDGKIMIYLDCIQYGVETHKNQYKYICMGVSDLDTFYRIQDAYKVPIQLRSEDQKKLLENVKIKRITILNCNLKNHKISYIKGQRKQPKNEINIFRDKDYSEWIQGHRSL